MGDESLMPDPTRLSAGKFAVEAPLPRWAVVLFFGLTLAGVGAFAYVRYLYQPVQLVTLQQANDAMASEFALYNQHIAETPEHQFTLFDDARGTATVSVYRNADILVFRRSDDGQWTKLMPDLARDTHQRPSRKPARSGVPAILPMLVAAQRCSGRCWNPHGGEFASWLGDRDGCWVQVHRRWGDSCEHFQNFDSCDGRWETNEDGSPRVTWICCVHAG